MNNSDWFSKYEIIYDTAVEIKTLLPLRVGASKDEVSVTEPDLPIIKNSRGVPIIPGSSLKGFFRANSQKLLESISRPSRKVDTVIFSVFGNMKDHASALYFTDLTLDESTGRIDIRKHIAIDPETGAVGRGKLFEAEMVQENSLFTGGRIIGRNIAPSALGLLFAVKHLADNQVVRLGGFKSRGYGAINIDFTKIEILLPGITPDALRRGVQVSSKLGPSQIVRIRSSQEEEITIEESGKRNSFSCSLSEDLAYFGVKVSITTPDRFLSNMTTALSDILTRPED